VAIRAVAVAAAITAAGDRSIGRHFEDLGPPYSSAASRLETVCALAQRIGRLFAQEELRGQQEQLSLTALETTGLDVPWLAAALGVSIERVNMLAQQKRRQATILKRSWALYVDIPSADIPHGFSRSWHARRLVQRSFRMTVAAAMILAAAPLLIAVAVAAEPFRRPGHHGIFPHHAWIEVREFHPSLTDPVTRHRLGQGKSFWVAGVMGFPG
jgi:hypothetical protein